ncbi:nucleoside deaminase [Xanthobacter sediminis]
MDRTDEPAAGAPSRRAVLAAVAAGAAVGVQALFPAEAAAEAVEVPVQADDERLMREAIALAAEADFPFGAVIVRDGTVLARGLNLGRRLGDPTAHGEMVAIRRFLATRPPDALKGTTLYTSGEPCIMCMGAITWCGISRVVFGASISELATRVGQVMISTREVAQQTPFARIELTGGVLRAEALALFDRKTTAP